MAWLKKDTRTRQHPKIIAAAGVLGVKPVHFQGHLDSLWLAALERYEDGDFSGIDNEQIAILAEWNPKTADRLVQVLTEKKLLDGRLIHDWLDYAGDYLKSKYRKSPGKLIAIYQKHGRENELPKSVHVGTCTGHVPDMSGTCADNNPNNPKTHNNPLTQNKDPHKTQGGLGDDAAAPPGEVEPPGSLNSSSLGSRVHGLSPQTEVPVESMGAMAVFVLFRDLFSTHSITGANELGKKVKACKTTPALWTMLFLDKVQYAMKNGGDPVALTMAGFASKQTPTDAASGLFRQIVLDTHLDPDGRGKRWERIFDETVTDELIKRKKRERS